MRRVFVLVVFASLMMSLGIVPVLAQGLQNVEVHGYVQNRFYANPDSTARFAVERMSLSAVGKLGEDGTAYVEVYFHPWITDSVLGGSVTVPEGGGTAPLTGAITAEEFRTYLESAYVDLPLGQGRIRIGKGRQLNFGMTPSYPNRKTTQYGILAETFTQDRTQGFQYSLKKGQFDFGASLYSDLNAGTRSEGDFPGALPTQIVRHIVDKDTPGQLSGRLAVTTRLGWTKPNFGFHVSGMTGGLNVTQLGAINAATAFNTPGNTNTDHNKYGVDTQYTSGPFCLQGEWYSGKWSFLGITGYSVLAGYQPKDKDRFYVRWAALNNDVAPIAGNAVTYNTQQLTVGIVHPIRKGVWAEINYERNLESTPAGSPSIDNDLLFLEIFSGF